MYQPVRMSALKKVIGNAHFEVAKGTAEQNWEYCTKDDNHAFEYGDRPEPNQGQGRRSDLLVLRDALMRKETDLELLSNDATVEGFFKYQRGIQAARSALNIATHRDNIRVCLFYGAPGTGKSHMAREIFPDAYWKDNTKWWPGYLGQKNVIWDEFGGWSTMPSEFNKVFDKYPHSVEVKGGTIPLEAENFIIISNFIPYQWWDSTKTTVDLRSIERRIHKFCFFVKIGDVKEFDSVEKFKDFCNGK